MKVMGRGDTQDWKVLGDEDANMFWYCKKAACLLAYRDRYLEMLREYNPHAEDEELIRMLRQLEPGLPIPDPDGNPVEIPADPDIPLIRG